MSESEQPQGTEPCVGCGTELPVGFPHNERECRIARERAVQEAYRQIHEFDDVPDLAVKVGLGSAGL